jgi:hypothetical protein
MVQILLLPHDASRGALCYALWPHRRSTVMEAANDYEGLLGPDEAHRPCAPPALRYVLALVLDERREESAAGGAWLEEFPGMIDLGNLPRT